MSSSLACTQKHGAHDRTSNAQPVLTCHLERPPPQMREAGRGGAQRNEPIRRGGVKSPRGEGTAGQEGREEAAKLRRRDCQLFR